MPDYSYYYQNGPNQWEAVLRPLLEQELRAKAPYLQQMQQGQMGAQQQAQALKPQQPQPWHPQVQVQNPTVGVGTQQWMQRSTRGFGR